MTVLGRIVKKDKKSAFLEILCLENIIFFFRLCSKKIIYIKFRYCNCTGCAYGFSSSRSVDRFGNPE
jgi:hypothetical protein